MKRIAILITGLMVLALVAGTATAAADIAPPLAQRTTPTPTPAVRIPVTLAVLPLPSVVAIQPATVLTGTFVLTGTGLLTGTQILTGAQVLTGVFIIPATPVITTTTTPTATLRAALTPTASARSTPTPIRTPTRTPTPTADTAPAAVDDAANTIVDFRAATGRTRGQIQLSWRFVGDSDDGAFVVERSANGGAWRFVADCSLPFAADTELYRCRDTALYSGSSYAYRICIAAEVASCAGASVVESEPIKAP